jgi:uncharacterized protein YggE
MFMRRLAMAAALVLALAASARVALAQEAPSSEGARPAVVAVGEGVVPVAPESARVTLGAEATASTLAEAQSEANRRMRATIDALRAAGVPESAIRTTSVSISPRLDRPEPQQPPPATPTEYRVTNLVEATVRVDALGPVVDAAVAAGANRVHGVRFEASAEPEARARARTLAVEEARRSAGQLAAAAGRTLGSVLLVEEIGVATPLVPFAARVETAATSTPIAPGQLEIRSVVRVRYALE